MRNEFRYAQFSPFKSWMNDTWQTNLRVEVEIKIEDYIFVKKKNRLLLPFLCNTLFLSIVTARRRLE